MQRQFSLFARICRRAMGTLLALTLCLLCSSGARAYEEQASFDLALGYAGIASSDTLRPHVGAFDLGASLGIKDFLVLRGALGYALLMEENAPTQHAGRARIELAYLVDVLKWVPFFGLGVGVWGVSTRGDLAFLPAGHGVLGLDYLVTRALTLGVDVRIGMLLQSGDLVSFTEGQFRTSVMFDLF
jgi:hypothetical protein